MQLWLKVKVSHCKEIVGQMERTDSERTNAKIDQMEMGRQVRRYTVRKFYILSGETDVQMDEKI